MFQDEKDFSFQVPTNRQNNWVYFNGPKKDVQWERLYSEGNTFSKKVMVSAVITWKGVSQPFFIGANEIKVNEDSYLKHLRDDFILLLKQCIQTKISHPCKIVFHRIAPIKCKTSWSGSWSPDLLRTLIAWLQHFRLLLLRPRSRWSLLLFFRNDWWVPENNLWRLGWMCNGSSPIPQSNETVSPPFGSGWRKRSWLNQNCFWIDINEEFIEHFVII